MSDFTVIETTGYQWACQLCGETGSLEISREFAKEAAQAHTCGCKHEHTEMRGWTQVCLDCGQGRTIE